FPAIETVLSGQRFVSRSVEAGSESTDRIVLQENQDQATTSDFHFSEGAILETLELAMNQIGVVTRCSRDFRYLWVNHVFAYSIQVPLDKIIGPSMSEVLGEEAFESLRHHFARVLAGEKVIYEEEVNCRGVGCRWISATYTPTFDSRGVVDGWIGVRV